MTTERIPPNDEAADSAPSTAPSTTTIIGWVMGCNFACLGVAYALMLFQLDAGMVMIFPIAVLCLVQLVVGLGALREPDARGLALGSILSAPLALAAGAIPFIAGAAWGRPLRIKGRQLHPDLREGSDWTRGDRPDVSALDEPTRRALAALWLHDAQKEHASVPAFSRISWMLAAVGAPADLMEWSHRAALEEIEHTRLCFALAAGYGGKSHSVQAMPDLLLGGLDASADPIVTLATESLSDGCQLEDYNADVARACALACEEPVTRAVLQRIAREERSHADFSWALLKWLLERSPEKVRPAIEKTLADLGHFRRPTAVGWDKKPIVALADPVQMLRHGRLPDEKWGELWEMRLRETRRRLRELSKPKLDAAA